MVANFNVTAFKRYMETLERETEIYVKLHQIIKDNAPITEPKKDRRVSAKGDNYYKQGWKAGYTYGLWTVVKLLTKAEESVKNPKLKFKQTRL